jgi:hypothetical protein
MNKYQGRFKLADFRADAPKLMAAECSGFLVGADPRSERWQPCVRWAKMLRRQDHVITFNYDLVLEDLNSHIGVGDVRPMVVPTPAELVHNRIYSGSSAPSKTKHDE